MTTGDSQSVQTTNTVCPIKSQLIHVKPYLSGEMRTRLQDSWHRTYKIDIWRTWTLGIHPYVHPGRTRCMRHGLPHARRIGRGMLLLLLPLRAFGHGRTGKFVDRAVAAGTLENPIAAGVDPSRHLA